MIEGLKPVLVTEFRGLWANGSPEVCPRDRFLIARNLRYSTHGFETRYGTSVSVGVANGVRRFFPYKIQGQTDRTIYLDAAGRFFDSLYPGVPILNIPNAIDFSLVVFNARAYITPHDGVRGLAGQVVFIYQGGGLPARPAAGTRPRGFTLQVAANGPGFIPAGTHLFAVAFETDSGFVTGPGPEVFARFDSVEDADGNGQSALLSNIGLGPTGTIARWILASKSILDYNGDQDSPELFFIPNGRIEDNVTTSVNLSFFDTELLESADYLRNQMETIPAVLGLSSFKNSLVGWGAQVDDSTVFVSKAGEPESISLLTGGIEVDRSAAGGVKNCVEFRSSLMIHKSTRTYAISSNGAEPSEWGTPDSVDRSVGTEVFGIASIADDVGNTIDRYIIAAKMGLLLFNGTFDVNLTWHISDVWSRITKNYFNTIQVSLDADNQYIYCTLPLDGANSPNYILFGDYNQGLDADSIRWSLWDFPYAPTCIGVDLDSTGEPIFKVGSINANIYKQDSTIYSDNLVAIPNPSWQTAMFGDDNVAVSNLGGVRLRATGVGALNLEVHGLDDTIVVRPPALALNPTPGKFLEREFNLSSQYGSLLFYTVNINERFKVSKINVFIGVEFMEEPA